MSFAIKTAVACILLAVASAKTVSECASNLPKDEFLQVHGNKCYYFHVNVSVPFKHAQKACVEEGGNLVSVKSKDVNKFLHIELAYTYDEQLTSRKVWIGLHDIVEETVFKWADNSTVSYTNWAAGKGPRHGLLSFGGLDEDCVAMDAKSGEWYDFKCGRTIFYGIERRPYICEF